MAWAPRMLPPGVAVVTAWRWFRCKDCPVKMLSDKAPSCPECKWEMEETP